MTKSYKMVATYDEVSIAAGSDAWVDAGSAAWALAGSVLAACLPLICTTLEAVSASFFIAEY